MSKLGKGFKNLVSGLNPQNVVKHFTSRQFSKLSREEKLEIARVLIPKAVQAIRDQEGQKQIGVFRIPGGEGSQITFLNKVANDPSLLEGDLMFEVTDSKGNKSQAKPSTDDLTGLIKKLVTPFAPEFQLPEDVKAKLPADELASLEKGQKQSNLTEEETAVLKKALEPVYKLFQDIVNTSTTQLTWGTLKTSASEIYSLMEKVGFKLPPKDS